MPMTEADWLSCTKATQPVMDWLRRRGGSERQFYLVGAAAVRHIWELLPDDRYRDLIVLVERYADGQVGREELSRAYRVVEQEATAQYLALTAQGMRANQAARRAAPALAAAFAAMPGGGWEAGCSALVEVVRTGKRADIWPRQCAMLRDIFGNPFRPLKVDPSWLTWNDGTVPKIARTIYEDRRYEELPILADALLDAGCTDENLLAHCRQPGEHVRGCWVLDRLKEKE